MQTGRAHAQKTAPPGAGAALRRAGERLARSARALPRTGAPARALALALGALYAHAAPAEGMTPFGLSYLAASAQPLAAAAGAFLGAAGQAHAAVYMACAVVLYAARTVLRDTAAMQRGWLMPLCAFLSLLGCKSVVADDGGARALALLLCESALCALGVCLLAQARRAGAPYCLWGRVAALALALLALAPLSLFGLCSPARAGGLLLVLACAYAGGPACGAAVGAACGAAFDLQGGAGLLLGAAWCFAGLAAGSCAHRRREGAAACALAALGAGLLLMPGGGTEALCEGVLACAALCLLPPTAIHDLERAFSRRPSPAAPAAESGRVTAVSRAVGALGTAMAGLWEEPPASDPAALLKRASEGVCRTCPACARCWTDCYQASMDALLPLLPRLREQGALDPADFPPHFAGSCLRLRRLCGAINDEHRAALRRVAAARRDREAQQALQCQYAGLEGALRDAARPSESLPALESVAKRVARAYLPRARASVWTRDGRMHVDLFCPADGPDCDGDALRRSLEGALRRPLLPPRPVETARGRALRLSQRGRLTASVSCSSRPKDGERVCGDASMQLHTADGRALILLSDGMGTGEAAARSAHSALRLLAGFSRAGCGLCESAAAVLPALSARMPHCGFVTLDLLEISLFTGRAQWLKLGAAPGYLLRAGQARAVCADSLPAGLSPASPPAPARLLLLPGDVLVMMSDGVADGLDCPAFLRAHGDAPAGELCAALLREAAAAGARDDLTVLTVRIDAPGA